MRDHSPSLGCRLRDMWTIMLILVSLGSFAAPATADADQRLAAELYAQGRAALAAMHADVRRAAGDPAALLAQWCATNAADAVAGIPRARARAMLEPAAPPAPCPHGSGITLSLKPYLAAGQDPQPPGPSATE